MNTFGYYLNKIRTEKGIKQKELAHIMGLSAAMISQYETDKRKPKPETIEKFAVALGCSMEELGYTINYWGIPEQLLEKDKTQEIVEAIDLLNDEGKEKVLNYALDLLESPKYKIPSF